MIDRRPPTAAGRPTAFLDVRDLRVHFPTDDGLVKSVDGVQLHPRTRQHPRHRGGVRLRQVRDQPGHPRPAQGHQGPAQRPDLAGRHRAGRRRRRGRPQAARQQDGDDLPGPAVGAAPVLHDRRPDRGGVPRSTTTCSKKAAWTRAIEMLDRVGIPNAERRGRTTTRTSSPAACASAR